MPRLHLPFTLLSLALLTGCPDDPATNPPPGPRPDAGADADAGTDGGMSDPDGGVRDGGDVVTGCPGKAPIPPAASGTCEVTAGSATLLVRGALVTPEGLLENGDLLVDDTGRVSCAACDCSAAPGYSGATIIACAAGVVSPALINAHDHITFTEAPPAAHPNEVFEHRHDWRRGRNNHTRIPSVSNQGGDRGIWWGELRNLLAGATSINGSGGAQGLLRNLDQPPPLMEGIEQPRVRYSTFPLGDSDGTTQDMGCAYGNIESPTDPAVASADAYAPHIAEGIDRAARNEFLCLSSTQNMGQDVLSNKTAIIHGIGLLASDINAMAAERASLIWSPRSNIDLYGATAQVVLAANAGVRIGLGSDWAISGSMNILRELQCAEEYNRRNLGAFFTDRQLIDMATSGAAAALKSDDYVGVLAPGRLADVTIWDGSLKKGYRAILEARPQDVALVLRSGLALYGDEAVVNALPNTAQGCEALEVCTRMKRVCAQRETGSTIADMRGAIAANAYDLFFCGPPPNEPTCTPFRPGEYMGMPSATDADGDGVMDTMDNCPRVFNPPRPLDGTEQADADNDLMGDACDACPLSPMTTCAPPDPNDRDGDMRPDTMDNCPETPNTDQADGDGDMIGDACDACPDQPNPGGTACSVRIYAIKQGTATGRARLANVVVTAVGRTGYFIQHAPGDASYDATLGPRFSGVFVFAGSAGMKPAQGDRVDVEGTIGEFFGQKQLSNATFTVLSSANPLPDPVVAAPIEVGTGGSRAEELEGVLVQVNAVTVTSTAPPVGAGDRAPINEFVVNDALRVNDFIYLVTPFPRVNEAISYVRGVLRLANDDHKLEPRSAEDVGTEVQLLGFDPMVAYAAPGSNGVPPGGFAVVLSRSDAAAQTVLLSSDRPEVTVPAMVVVASGQARADVPVTIAAGAMGAATITARLGTGMVQGSLQIVDDAAPREVVRLTLSPVMLPPNGTAQGEVELDQVGATGGTVVTLTLTPPGLATVPATVVVPAGRFLATFSLSAGTTLGGGTLVASVGTSSVSAGFTVSNSTSRPPMPGDLVITEVHRNPGGTNEKEREWFEVLNVSADTLLLDGLQIADNSVVHTINQPGLSLAPGAYGIFAYFLNAAQNGGVTALAEYGAADIQLANGDDLITLTHSGATIDVVDWAAGWPGGGNGVSMCLKFPYAADNNVAGAWANSVGGFGSAGDTGSPGVASSSTNCP